MSLINHPFFSGSALAQVGANLSFFVFTLGYILISKCYEETWDGKRLYVYQYIEMV